MMLRAPRTTEFFHAPPDFLCAGEHLPTVGLPIGGSVRPTTLRAFVRAMAAQGVKVQSARLGYDRLYAFECLARAHACDDPQLRDLALELFTTYQR